MNGLCFQQVDAPLECIPLFARSGAILPRYAQPPDHLKGPVPTAWNLDIYPGDSMRRLSIAEDGFEVKIAYHSTGGQARLEINPVPLNFTIRLASSTLNWLRVNREDSAWEQDKGEARFSVDARRGLLIVYGIKER